MNNFASKLNSRSLMASDSPHLAALGRAMHKPTACCPVATPKLGNGNGPKVKIPGEKLPHFSTGGMSHFRVRL